MNNIVDYLFGPLEKSYFCTFFLVLTIFGFVFFIAAIIILLYGLSKQIGSLFYVKSFMMVFFYFVFYLQSRILYSMCGSTLVE